MAYIKHKGIGFSYIRRSGTWNWYTKVRAKCLYDFGPKYYRFFWEYGCGFYDSLYLNDNHCSDWIYVDCYSSFIHDSNFWTHYGDLWKCK